jgi:hypothetical protein
MNRLLLERERALVGGSDHGLSGLYYHPGLGPVQAHCMFFESMMDFSVMSM